MSFLNSLPPDLKAKIIKVIKANPETVEAFNDLFFYALNNHDQILNLGEGGDNKRRKVADTTTTASTELQKVEIIKENIILLLPKISFQSPLRKKLNLVFAIDSTSKKPVLAVVRDEEYEKPDLVLTKLTNANIIYAAFLPMPEKPKLMYFVIFYKENFGNQLKNDPIIMNFNQERLNEDLKSSGNVGATFKSFKQRITSQGSMFGFNIEDPFINQMSFFVDAHKGTKEGILYFLPNNILFGFKKPILLYESKNIKSITYSSITRVTFNITLLVKIEDPETKEITEQRVEFSMIDQNEFAKIDAYIKAKEVVDNSMAEELKAKPLHHFKSNENPVNPLRLEEEEREEMEGVGEEEEEEEDEGEVGHGKADDSDDEEEDGTYEIGDSDDSEGSGNSDSEGSYYSNDESQ